MPTQAQLRTLILKALILLALSTSGYGLLGSRLHAQQYIGGLPGEEVEVSIRTCQSAPVTGFGLERTHDPQVASLLSVELGADVLALNGGTGPLLDTVVIYPGEGFAVFVATGIENLAPGQELELARARYLLLDAPGEIAGPWSGSIPGVQIGNQFIHAEEPTVDCLSHPENQSIRVLHDEDYTLALRQSSVLRYPQETGIQSFDLRLEINAESSGEAPLGLSADIAFDATLLTFNSLNLSKAIAELRNGSGPEFLSVDEVNGGVQLQLVLDSGPQAIGLDVRINPDQIATLSFDTIPTLLINPPSNVIPIEIEIGDQFGGSFSANSHSGPRTLRAENLNTNLIAMPPRPYLRGDCNLNATFDLADIITTLGYLFTIPIGPRCPAACDMDDSKQLNIADPIYGLAYLYAGGPPLPSPFPDCGTSPEITFIECRNFACTP